MKLIEGSADPNVWLGFPLNGSIERGDGHPNSFLLLKCQQQKLKIPKNQASFVAAVAQDAATY